MAKSYTRTPPPRQLGPKETLESLTHWRTSFKTFYKRDEAYKRFFKFGVVWNNEEENYGFTDDGGDYSAEDIAEDLRDLLNTLASFLPYSYLTDKILNTTTCWEDVWRIINDLRKYLKRVRKHIDSTMRGCYSTLSSILHQQE